MVSSKFRIVVWVMLAAGSLALAGCQTQANASEEIEPTDQNTVKSPAEAAVVDTEIPPEVADSDSEQSKTSSDSASSAVLFDSAVTASGEVILISGRVLDVNGTALPGVAVEIWQTDGRGVYDHPGDPSTASRDTGFQFYGTSVSDEDGVYVFRTVLPGEYEPRPRHIHVKVRRDGGVALVTQFYFPADGVTAGVGGSPENLFLTMGDERNSLGQPIPIGRFDIVLDTGIGAGTLDLTDSQGEGPYYPVVDVSPFDNDLASVEN